MRCRAEAEGGEGADVAKQFEQILQNEATKNLVESLAEKVMQDEESKALLQDLAAATERVEKAKLEMERTNRLEQEILYVENQMARIIAEQNLADSLVRFEHIYSQCAFHCSCSRAITSAVLSFTLYRFSCLFLYLGLLVNETDNRGRAGLPEILVPP